VVRGDGAPSSYVQRSRVLHDGVRQIRSSTGFDRVMNYRFDDSGAGEWVAESLAPKWKLSRPSFSPHRNIPVQARALYLRNPFRIIADVVRRTCLL